MGGETHKAKRRDELRRRVCRAGGAAAVGVTGDDYSGPQSPACTLSRKTGDRISLRSYVRILTVKKGS